MKKRCLELMVTVWHETWGIFLMALGLHIVHLGLEMIRGTFGNVSFWWSVFMVLGFLIARAGYVGFATRRRR